MRAFLTLLIRPLRTGWFWAFVLLALPNCGLQSGGYECQGPDDPVCETECEGDCEEDPPCPGPECECDPEDPECPLPAPVQAFDPGPSPVSDAIYCDFPRPLEPGESDCATSQNIADGMSYAYAAVALVQGETRNIALDFTDSVVAACGGVPRKTEFLIGSFPDGETVCLNCGTQIEGPSPKYASLVKACIAKCQDTINFDFTGTIPAEGAQAFCEAHVTLSTNSDPDTCYHGACTNGGPNLAFDDPRKHQEKVVWIDGLGVSDLGGTNTLQRTAATTGNGDSDFNAGAASAQLITTGDGWVEFQAGENGVSHVIGVRESPCDDVVACPDTDPGLTGIGYALSLNNDNNIYVLEQGTPLFAFAVNDTYTPTQRFRVEFTDNNDDTATIRYYRLAGACVDGTACAKDLLYTSTTTPHYPLRVDAIFREVNATLQNVTIVRIQQ